MDMTDCGVLIMKSCKKVVLVIASIVILCICVSIPGSAERVSGDGVEFSIKTDKTQYSQGDYIVVTLTVKNNNRYSVNNVNLEGINISKDNIVNVSKSNSYIESIGGNDSASMSYVYKVNSTSDENINIVGVIGTAIFVVLIVIAAVLIIMRLVEKKKTAFVIMTICIVAVGFAVTSFGCVNAIKKVSTETTVNVDGEAVDISAIVDYETSSDNSVFNNTINVNE